jgi:hypothetical protein
MEPVSGRTTARRVGVPVAIVLLVVIGSVLLVRPGSPAPDIPSDVSRSGAEPSPTFVPAKAPSVAELPPDTRAVLDSLPDGTILVACNSSVSKYPEGVRPHRPLGFEQARPGFAILPHGYCVDNPKATPIPIDIPFIDQPGAVP